MRSRITSVVVGSLNGFAGVSLLLTYIGGGAAGDVYATRSGRGVMAVM